ncbi:MAG TPA: alpha-2-macroglobulin family protein, partial [Alloprevotella sp.]|nr:alpha-2-macroglobulin family protein [Alloprevotella sp.]
LFTSWNEQLFGNSRVYSFLATGKTAGLGMLRTAKQMSFVQNAAVDTKNEAKMEAAEAAPPTEEADAGGSDAPTGVTPRSNFAETAFFHPALRTDAEGGVSISFTLPESLTSWNFNALAHTRSMETGTLDTTVIARKDFMVQAALPRFVRTGDRVVLSAILRNLTDRPIEGTLSWQLTDPQTNRVVKTLNEKFSLVPSGATSRDFGFTAPDGYNLLACRVVAAGNGFSDGEEHPLPILPDRVEVTRSLPFSVTETGMRTLRIDTLWNGSKQASDRRLTVETASNPTWYAVSALPVLADDECHSAAEWATRYYALTLGSSLASTLKQAGASFPEKTDKENGVLSPLATQNEILLTETPWAAHAASETERAAALTDLLNPELSAIRRHTALDQLRSLQLPDGSWSWYKGMRGNSYITSEVAVLLARTRRLTGDRTATQPLERALAFLKDEIRKTVLGMKEYERKHKQTATLDEASLRYLYLRALMGLKPDNDTRYLLDKAERPDKRQTMYGKALVTVALAAAGRTEPALAALQSLTEHTVLSPETGRYFDTDRAQWSWASYRIPTQTAAIEALTALRPDNDPIAEEMRLWLMQAKRTQSWETSRATADAVYALLARAPKDGTVMSVTETTQPLLYTLNKGRTIVAASAPSGTQAAGTVGYSREDYTDKAALSANSITLNKRTKGLSWGSVRTSCTVPSADVAASSKGLGVTCLVQVERGGTWRLLRTGDKVRKGERLRKVFTLTADRDY